MIWHQYKLFNKNNRVLYRRTIFWKNLSSIAIKKENTIKKLVEDPNDSEIDRLDVLDIFIKKIDDNLLDLFDKADELKTADAILEILKKRENIDIINKALVWA